MMTLLARTRNLMTQQRLIPPGAKVVIGVSGGADSLALLHILHALSPALMLEIHAATLDHGLRGAAGAADARFVADLCQQWSIPVTVGALTDDDLNTHAGIENAARVARYDFLARVAHINGAQHIAVAHHADDQAETVLMHFLRGTGFRGLAGMSPAAPLPDHPDLMLIRPLLHATRQDLVSYCQQQGLVPRDDATNQDTRLLRNRLRLETLPYLRQINPQFDRALLQMAAIADTNLDYIQQAFINAITGHITITEERLTLSRDTFLNFHPALQQQAILWAADQLTTETIGYDHVITAVELGRTGQTGQRVLLPGQLQVRLDYEQIVIEKQTAPLQMDQPRLNPGTVLPLQVPGLTPIPDSDWAIEVSAVPLTPMNPAQLQLKTTLQQAMSLRTRQAGDVFAPLGMGGHRQKLKKWLVDHKVPQAHRDSVPLLTIDGEIAAFYMGSRWIIHEQYAVTTSDQPRLYIRFVHSSTQADSP